MPIFLDTSKHRKFYFRGVTAFLLFALLGSILLFFFGLSFASATRDPITYESAAERYHYYYSAANDKKVAITIDDGPHAPATEELLTKLKADNVPATFFYIGEHVFARPDLVKEASDDGFDIGSHSFTHAYSVQSSYDRLAVELHSTGYLISQITGKKPLFYRPPYLLGIGIDPTVNPYIPPSPDVLWSLEIGYLPVGSDIDPKDWLATSTDEIVTGLATALHNTPNGHIILLHEDVLTAHAIDDVVAYLKTNGYTIVPLSQLLTPPTDIALASTMKLGDTDTTTNGDVSRLQWFLYSQKYLDAYALTGVFDDQTKAALASFQETNKLVDPKNPNPKVLGITDASTRDLIHKISETESQPDAGPVLVEKEGLVAAAGGVVVTSLRTAYVYLFPVLHSWLVASIFITLILVLGRSLGLVVLIIWGNMRPKPSLSIDTSPGTVQRGVSVLIPAYNEQENIAATVESIIRTSYPRREIIVIDDGSKDNTSGEVEKVIAAYPNDGVRLVRVENGGKARALNTGLEHAQYEIIVVLDADAVLDKEALWHFTKHFDDERVGAVAGKVRTTGSSTLLDTFQTLEYAMGQNIDKRAFSNIGAVGVVPGPAGAWRRQTILDLGGFSTETLVEDQDMTLTVLRSGRKVIYEPLAIAYTETPHSLKNFLKQRFRWVYGTMQCFWKHKGAVREGRSPALGFVVLPNIFIFNIALPLMYPFADSTLVVGLLLGQWQTLVLPFVAFTLFDMSYAVWGVWQEPKAWKLLLAVPLQRIVYRQLLYYTVMKGVVRALEGTGSSWNKFAKMGETRRFYFTSMLTPVPSSITSGDVALEIPHKPMPLPAPEFAVESVALAVAEESPQTAPAWSGNMLVGVFDEPSPNK